MKFIKNPLLKRLTALRYLRDELSRLKFLSKKGEMRLHQLNAEIKAIEEQLNVPEYKETA